MPQYSFSPPKAPGSEDSFRTAATHESALQPLEPSWPHSRDNALCPDAGFTGRGFVDLPLIPARQRTVSSQQSQPQEDSASHSIQSNPRPSPNHFVCTAPASSIVLSSRHATREPPSRFLMHHMAKSVQNSTHLQVQQPMQFPQQSTAARSSAQPHSATYPDNSHRAANSAGPEAPHVSPQFNMHAHQPPYGDGYGQAYTPTAPSNQASSVVQSAGHMTMPLQAQNVLHARKAEHRPQPQVPFTPISSDSPVLTDSVPTRGVDIDPEFARGSSSADDEHIRSDFVFAPQDYMAQYGLQRRKALYKAWFIQIAVFALMVGSIVAVPHHQRRVQNRENKETSDWVAGDVPGFLLALLLPALYVLCYMWYLQQCYNTSTAVRIQKLNRKICVRDYEQQLRACRPSVVFTATCYHYESRIRYERGEKKLYRLSVVTHQAKKVFRFNDVDWHDESPEFAGTDDFLLTSLLLKKDLSLTEAARERFFREFNTFCKKNHFDVNQDFCRVLDIQGFKENQTFFSISRPPPWWVSAAVYWVTAILLVNVPFRMFLDSRTRIVRHRVVKHVAA